MDTKKKDLYFEITGERQEALSGSALKSVSGSTPVAKPKTSQTKTDRPVHSASKIAHLGLNFEQQVNKTEEYSQALLGWMAENEPTKLTQSKEKWKLLRPEERQAIVAQVRSLRPEERQTSHGRCSGKDGGMTRFEFQSVYTI